MSPRKYRKSIQRTMHKKLRMKWALKECEEVMKAVLAELLLPSGVWESGDGVYKATCCSCERDYELPFDPKDFTEEGNFCGGSERCIP